MIEKATLIDQTPEQPAEPALNPQTMTAEQAAQFFRLRNETNQKALDDMLKDCDEFTDSFRDMGLTGVSLSKPSQMVVANDVLIEYQTASHQSHTVGAVVAQILNGTTGERRYYLKHAHTGRVVKSSLAPLEAGAEEARKAKQRREQQLYKTEVKPLEDLTAKQQQLKRAGLIQ